MGNAWELRAYVRIDPVSGKHKYATRTVRADKREAEEALARFVAEVAGGGHSARDATVADLIGQWLDLAKDDLSPSTLRGYRRIINSYILPTLGSVALARLRTAQLDRFYAELRDGGGQDGAPLAPATVRQTHAVFRRALDHGLRWGWISTNPAVLGSPPRVRAHQITPPKPEDVIKLIERAETEHPELGCFLLLALAVNEHERAAQHLLRNEIDRVEPPPHHLAGPAPHRRRDRRPAPGWAGRRS